MDHGEFELMCMGIEAYFRVLESGCRTRLTEAKTDAILANVARCTEYLRQNFFSKLVFTILEKKLKFINEATTVAEIEKFKQPSAPQYDCGRFYTDDTWIPEEELIQWSMVSLKAPLAGPAFDRYAALFQQIMCIDSDI